MSDQKRTPRAGSALPGQSLRPSPPSKGSPVPKGSGASPPAAKAAPPVRNNPATRSIPVTKPQQPAASGRPAPQDASAGNSSKPGKPARPGKSAKRATGAKRPAPAAKGTVAKGLLGSKGGPKRAPLRTGPGAKDAAGPPDEPSIPQPDDASPEPLKRDQDPGAVNPPAPEAQGPQQPAEPVPALADLASHTESPAWLSGEGAHDAEVWTGVFESQVQQAAAEPEVIPSEDVHLTEPSLEIPSISPEAAEAASLSETAAEVRAVAEEAAEAGKQAGISEPAPEGTEIAVQAGEGITDLETEPGEAGEGSDGEAEDASEAQPDGEGPEDAAEEAPKAKADTDADSDADDAEANAGTVSGTGTETAPPITTAPVSGGTDVDAPVTDSFASLTLTKKVPAEDSADTGITHTVTPSGSTAVPADSRRARRTREAEEAAAKSNGASRTTRMLVLIGSILIIVLLGIWLATAVADSNREAGVLEDSVAPVDLEAGACLQDFQSVNAEVTVVTCDTAHNAQLVASQSYPDTDAFPGTDALSAKAEEVCSSVMYTDAASKYTDLELNRAVPTQSSWDAGDRRVDCFVVAPGQELTESLIVQP